MTEFKEAMSKVSNTVSLLAFNSGQSQGELKAITISSLISVSVVENEEEVLFVLKKDSSVGKELFVGKEISINVLSNLQSDIAQVYGGGPNSRVIGLSDQIEYWDNSQNVPELIGAHLVFIGKIEDIIGRKSSNLFLSRISRFSISNESEPLIHYLRRYQSPNPHYL
jgi:flavin reductase (DIM6/NTAB) family NADH-FMN oxidoreductase RutF